MKYRKLTVHILEMGIAQVTEDYPEINGWSVADWLSYSEVPKEFAHLPEAIKAQEIMDSPLFRAMQEGEDAI